MIAAIIVWIVVVVLTVAVVHGGAGTGNGADR